MPKGSEELTAARREEIINACEKLYRTMRFKEITIKEIGRATSFTRTSIYNYFETKEEIFLALLKREYDCWCESLAEIAACKDERAELVELLARSLEARPNMLKLLSMNMYDIEENSRLECLTDFKVSFGRSMALVRECLKRFFPDMDDGEQKRFIYSFFPFIHGIYPYTSATEKQKCAMKNAKVEYVHIGIYEIAYRALEKLLKR